MKKALEYEQEADNYTKPILIGDKQTFLKLDSEFDFIEVLVLSDI